ncbi:MAG: hypothetical protein PHO02_06680 [Candidatus Nanoarchaeia archaeon]|nr:hypothetical protein [Candidatus Nanoarchaeia archaeon]
MANKRGQVTLFVILGIVIVAIIVLLLAFRKDILPKTGSPENIDATMKGIEKGIRECMAEAADEPITRIGLQGGYLSTPEGSYRRWNDYAVSYLCYNQAGKETCTNRFLTMGKMEEQLSEAITENMGKCMDIDEFASLGLIKTIEVIPGNAMDVTVSIAKDVVNIELNYKVEVKGSSGSKVKDKFEIAIRSPLGELYEVSQDIIDSETTFGRFDQLTYMLNKMSLYTIYVQKPYPDKIYQIKLREKDYMFQFAVEGEPS